MRAFDQDGNGRVDYEEFLRGVRGRLSPTRKKMVRQIFDALDKIGGGLGYLTIAAIQPVYSVSNHPQVKAGKMTKAEALQEFLNGFEGSQGNRDGRVTLDEWIKYYEEVCAVLAFDPLSRTRRVCLPAPWSAPACATV
jgi:Ca2+-binding EF-hand superfamily protein